MAAPYWGKLPPPTVTRGNSLRREDEKMPKPYNHLAIDTSVAGDRLSNQYPTQPQTQSRQNRYSTQTDAPTISTQSPFASPIASEFRGEGLAPRPPSFQYGVSEAQYNREYLEKRRRRESRNRDQVDDEPSAVPPPAAPDVPRAPPVSYKQPYVNGPPLAQYAVPGRARSTRRSEGPVSPGKAAPEEYYRSHTSEEQKSVDEEGVLPRRMEPINGKAGVRPSGSRRERPDRLDSYDSQPRKASLSEADAKRRREWAPDRSPLQRLELTLDSITKEEKRARVEEAELIAREAKAGRGGEKATQNSVRFRNRPVAKAPEPGSQVQPQSLPEAGLVRNLSNKQKDQLQRSGTVESKRPVESNMSSSVENSRGFNYEPGDPKSTNLGNETIITSAPQRGPSFRDRSYLPVAAGAVSTAVSRSGSNKLKKAPPGDPWLHRRIEGEKKYPDVIAPRQPHPPSSDHSQAVAGPSRDTAFRSHPQAAEKELPRITLEDGKAPSDALGYLDDETENKPVRRGTLKKIEQLTGEKQPLQNSRSARPGEEIRTEVVTVNGTQYAVTPTIGGPTQSAPRSEAQAAARQPPTARHLLPNLLHHRHEETPGQGVYIPSRRLDEWKKGGVALLAGPLLDLDVVDQSEAEKDKAWWEAGNTGKRRRSSTSRKAEAYDGEYDDTNGMPSQKSHSSDCARCTFERDQADKANLGTLETTLGIEGGSTLGSPRVESPGTLKEKAHTFFHLHKYDIPLLKPHLLTCPLRSIRVRPDIAPTRFKPPLFLKCGPLLRYCGLRRDKPKSRSGRNAVQSEREIWRGSVMIVTQDANSSYELAPTLRLFLQPMELLPPPPAQVDGEIDELAPEYIDPIAGLPKIERDGRTLYIRPVDHLEEAKDLSRENSVHGLYEEKRSPVDGATDRKQGVQYDGEKAGKYKEVRGFRLHAEQGVTFWRFNLEIELRDKQQRIAYRINRGPATGFWIPARDQAMNIMFHSCNGFSHDVDTDSYCGPDPMWRDVLNTHQTQPFHVMLGGGDQIYNDRVMEDTKLYKEWMDMRDEHHKEKAPFTPELQAELEEFYLNRYCMWFSQGLFSIAVSQIPMINIFDDHDIIDGFGSYPDHYMSSPIFSGLGSIAFKFYMLFQHQSSIDEGEETEPTWVLGTQPGPYIKELSRSTFTHLGRSIAFLGLDCRTERMNDEIVSAETYHKVFARLGKEIIKGETKHLIVLVGIPVAYPRMVWLENLLTSRAMEPIKMLGRAGLLGRGLLNHMDGGVEILDDLDDHWTAKHHKAERNWFIQELQDLAAEKSVRVTILGGDVHLGAIGQFYSNPKLGLPKDRDFRYMPNVISSAIVNAPPPDTLADLLNKRNKVHHLDADTDEDMIPIFTHDVNGKPRNNKRLLNRRNWCSIRQYNPELSPPPTPQTDGSPSPPPREGLFRRLSKRRGPTYRADAAPVPPLSNAGFFGRRGSTSRRSSVDSQRPGVLTRTLSLTRRDFMPTTLFRRNSKRRPDDGGINGYGADSDDDISHYQNRSGIRGGSGGRDDDDGYFPTMPVPTGRAADHPVEDASTSVAGTPALKGLDRSLFHRTPTGLSQKQLRKGNVHEINLEGGLDICLNMEVSPKDPAGITMPYRLLVPALWYDEDAENVDQEQVHLGGLKRLSSVMRGKRLDKGKEREYLM
ncbi:hypothetical protein N431DRAFT_382056 [Stipitochalara longipes BDJ]|nr:hypothetical protein N431DRAFT_382056 [Stipitochalara longipes BDJ]